MTSEVPNMFNTVHNKIFIWRRGFIEGDGIIAALTRRYISCNPKRGLGFLACAWLSGADEIKPPMSNDIRRSRKGGMKINKIGGEGVRTTMLRRCS